MDEAELIDGCRRGDRDAQHALYELYAERIYRLTLRLSGNAQDAFDLTHETFVRAFERISTFDGRAGIGTWLHRIATNEALQLFRRRGTEQRHLRALAEQRDAAANTGSQPDRLDVSEALSRLSDSHRMILVLKYQQGMSYDQIAEIMEIPLGTVASRMNRARTELRTILVGQSPQRGKNTALSGIQHEDRPEPGTAGRTLDK